LHKKVQLPLHSRVCCS